MESEINDLKEFSEEILPVSEITNLSTDKVNDIINNICNIIQNNIPEYGSIMNSYILYIEKLNIDQQTDKKSSIKHSQSNKKTGLLTGDKNLRLKIVV